VTTTPPLPVTIADVEAAARRLAGVAVVTPVLESEALNDRAGVRLLVKAEPLQRTGSFKFRGAFNKIAALPPEERQSGVLAFSSGNHAQAVALAARLLETSATIVMPADAPALKLTATRNYGAEVVTYDRYREDREEIGGRIARERGLALVRPFDDLEVIAGQGTAALELIGDAPGLDLLLAPVSGGGLIAGCATAAKTLCPGARVIGVEPQAGDDYARSLAAGRRVSIGIPDTIADALRLTTPGELTFAINQSLLDAVVTVSDAELIVAMRFAFERLKLVVEPGGAAALAALLAHRVELTGNSRVGVILSGGNVDPDTFAGLLGN
jgi:threo-3-hydroxy-L-aspartate ammonia-lyase